MFSKLIPTYLIKNIFELDLQVVREKGFKYIFLDLDNTLDSYKTKLPSDRVKGLIKAMKDHEITPIIISNNNSERVHLYGKLLNIDVYSNMNKPFKKRLNELLRKKKYNPKEILMVGDQLFTDIWGGNNIGVTTLFVEKIVDEDQFVTKIKRPLEKIFKKKIYKKNLSKMWRNTNDWIKKD